MSRSDGKQREQWVALLTENHVPESVAKQATDGLKHSNWGSRTGFIFVVVMVVLMAVFTVSVGMMAERPCEGDFALNGWIALLLAMGASIPTSGLAVGYAQKLAPMMIRKSAFVGAFTDPKNLPYARALAKSVSERGVAAADFETFEAEFSYTLLPWFLWPSLALLGSTIAALLFLPDVCV